MLDKITVDDLKKSARFLSVALSEDRLSIIADFLNQNLETLRSLTRRHLPKELEPSSYLKVLSRSREED